MNLGSTASTFTRKLQGGIFKFNIKRESLLSHRLQNGAALVRLFFCFPYIRNKPHFQVTFINEVYCQDKQVGKEGQ